MCPFYYAKLLLGHKSGLVVGVSIIDPTLHGYSCYQLRSLMRSMPVSEKAGLTENVLELEECLC